MEKRYMLLLILAISGISFFLWACGTGWADHPKNWIYEGDLLGGSNVQVTPEMNVILGMEKADSPMVHSIPYVFEERTKYNFCIDQDDPLIDSMKLVNTHGLTLVRVNKKTRCVERTVPKGHYTMEVYHDGNAVGDSPPYAFIHTPKASLPLGQTNPWAAASSTAAQGAEKATSLAGGPLLSGGYWTIEANNGMPLRLAAGVISPSDDTNFSILRFQFNGTSGAGFGCETSTASYDRCCFLAVISLCTNPNPDYPYPHNLVFLQLGHDAQCDGSPDNNLVPFSSYSIVDNGDYSFGLDMGTPGRVGMEKYVDAYGDEDVEMVFQCGGPPFDGTLHLAAVTLPAEQVPADSLQKGQAVFYSSPGCSGTATVVMPGNHVLEVGAASAHIPHDTRITLYQQGTGRKVVLNGGPLTTCLPVAAGFIAESMTVDYTKDILISTKQCRYCDLYGFSFQNMFPNNVLDGLDLSYAYLVNTRFNGLSMKGVNLSNVVLAGAQLDQANLQGSNMCNAKLQGNEEILLAASLNGTYMKNVNLSGANLSGVSMINTDFYNTGALPCPASCDPTQMTSTCATAAYATMDGTQATPAYLARTDFSSMKATGANFSGSVLVGANFNTAQLHTDASSTARTNFSHAFLQGADFTGASGDNTSFYDAYVDYTCFSGPCVNPNPKTHLGFQLPGAYAQFNGFWSTSGSSICVDGLNPTGTVVPSTGSSNICPDGSWGPCSTQVWTSLSAALGQADPKAGYGLCSCDVFGNCGDATWLK